MSIWILRWTYLQADENDSKSEPEEQEKVADLKVIENERAKEKEVQKTTAEKKKTETKVEPTKERGTKEKGKEKEKGEKPKSPPLKASKREDKEKEGKEKDGKEKEGKERGGRKDGKEKEEKEQKEERRQKKPADDLVKSDVEKRSNHSPATKKLTTEALAEINPRELVGRASSKKEKTIKRNSLPLKKSAKGVRFQVIVSLHVQAPEGKESTKSHRHTVSPKPQKSNRGEGSLSNSPEKGSQHTSSAPVFPPTSVQSERKLIRHAKKRGGNTVDQSIVEIQKLTAKVHSLEVHT
jgi:hypothetical protein